MNCNMFNKNLMAYIEEDLPYSVREEMREHLKECEACRATYEKKLFIRDQFSEVFNNEQLAFSSVKQGVMSAIKDTEYDLNWFQKLCYHFKRFGSSYAAILAMLAFIVLVVPNMGRMMKKNDKSTESKASKSIAESNLSGNSYDKPMQDGSKGSIDSLDKALADIKTKELGVGPWKTVFADNNRIYFYNYSHLLVYDNLSGNGGIAGAVDLTKLDVGEYQGSSVVHFIPSNNGDYCIIGNNTAELDMVNNKKALYMYNAKSNRVQEIGQENLALIKTTWSSSSQYFAYGDIKGSRVTIYDADKMIKQQVDFNKGEVKKLFAADNGDILINSNRTYILRKENSYKPEELKINGEALGFSNGQVIYFSEGSIYKYNSKGSTEINRLGKDYGLYKEDDKNIIFMNNEKLRIYDIKSNELHECSSKYLQTSKNFSPDLKKFIDNDLNCIRIINSNGTVNEGATLERTCEYYWKDNNTLVTVNFKENPKYLGDFVIENVDTKTGKTSIIFEMK